jgi:hypothetical protein
MLANNVLGAVSRARIDNHPGINKRQRRFQAARNGTRFIPNDHIQANSRTHGTQTHTF